MKFRKKPTIINAEQFKIGPTPHVPRGIFLWSSDDHAPRDGSYGYVKTAGGNAHVWANDWIIEEPDERGYYPCKPDIFEASYEPVGDSAEKEEQSDL